MDKKPDLTVKLFAGDTLVDQSTDVALWQRVLSEIRGLILSPPATDSLPDQSRIEGQDSSLAIRAFAKSLSVTLEEILGSLDPTAEAPFIHLNSHDWEALRRNTPLKGPGAISSSVLAATALVLWQKHSAIGEITLQTVRATMNTIDLDDKNAARSIANCEWLQTKANRIALNPSRASAAVRLVKSYCRREPLAEAG
jgi:hypothetical protein